MKTLSVLLCITVLMTSGCSTMMGRAQEDTMVQFDSNVKDVEVRASGKVGFTPCALPLKRSRSHSVKALKDGYITQMLSVKSGMSGMGFAHSTGTNLAAWGWWSWGIGLVLGWAVDMSTGSMRDIKDTEVFIEMREETDALI